MRLGSLLCRSRRRVRGPLLWAFALLAGALPPAARGHNGAILLASPPGIDGGAQPLRQKEYGNPWHAADFDAALRASWTPTTGLLQVDIDVHDDDVVTRSPTTPWDQQDGCELYIDTEHTESGSQARQYTLRGPWDAGSDSMAAAQASWTRTESGYTCSWRLRLPLSEARRRGGTTIGFDAAVSDFDGDGSFSWTAWGPGVEKQSTPARRGDLVLPALATVAAEPAVAGTLEVRLHAADGVAERGAAGPMPARVRLQVHSTTVPGLWATLRSDADGVARARLPAGIYEVRGRGDPAAIVVAAGGRAVHDQGLPRRPPQRRTVGDGRRRAGTGARKGLWHTFGQADGLAGGTVQALLQDDDGAMWIATRSGLSRYDGAWEIRLDANNGLPSGDVRDLARTEAGLWIGTARGLCLLAADQLRCYDGAHGLPDAEVTGLAADDDGVLWVATPLGLARFDGERFETRTAADGLPANMVSDVAVDAGGAGVWVATWGGLGRLGADGPEILSSRDGLPGDVIFDLDSAADGSLWIAARGGLGRLAEGVQPAVWNTAAGLPSDFALAVHADSYGRIWVATGTTIDFQTGSGLCRTRDQEAGGFECFTVDDGLASNQIEVIAEDREGLMWVGSTAGVSRTGDAHFRHYGTADGLGHMAVQDILRTRAGDLWVATEQGLSRLRGDRFETFGVDDGLPGAAVWSLLEDRQGILWVGTDAGLARYLDGRFTVVDGGPTDNLILALEEDAEGRIWIGTWTAGAFAYDGSGFLHLTPKDGLGGPEVDAILADSRGRIWLGGWQAGVSVYEDGRLRTLTTAQGLVDPTVICLAEDAAGRVWVGTERGLSLWEDGSFTGYTTAQGLAHDVVRDLQTDDEGRLWIGTDAGVNLFDGQVFQSLLPRDGLRSNEIRALLPDGKGGMWIGSTRGLTGYRPRRVQPSIQIVDVETDQRQGPLEQVATTMDVPLTAFEFQGISFKTRPEGMRYRYRLLGRDSTWTLASHSRVEYRDLEPGRYTFEVQAIDRDLDVSEPARVTLMVHLPVRSLLGWAAVTLACGLVLVLFVQTVRRNRSLTAANEAAREASETKSRFLANMSHEIRTPMNGVVGMTELLAQTELSSQQRGYLDTINQSADALLAIINDILDLSKIEAGRLHLEETAFVLHEVVDGVMRMMSPRAHDRHLELAARIDPGLPHGVVGDPVRLRQILVNLVGNALKFTESGKVILDMALDSRDDGAVVVHGAVRDTGIGVPADKLRAIFESFSQADASTTRHYGGTGLGLSICVELTRMMGGRIWVESEGAGSTFHFTVRFEVADDLALPATEAQLTAALAGLRILVVDDNATNRQILEEVLQGRGATAVSAERGPEALTVLRAAVDADDAFDIALVDAMMPTMDGLDVVRHIRGDPGLADLDLVMLTSLDDPGYLAQARAEGVADVLHKPVTQSDLLEALWRLVGDPQVPSPAPATGVDRGAPVPSLAPLRVLIAEDNPVNLRVARQLLEGAGHSVETVGNGAAAVERVTASAAELEAELEAELDVVLMDVQMPKLGGHEATRRIRRHERSHGGHLSIIGLTAHAMAGDRDACLEAGMDDYVAKPVRRAALFEALARVRPEAVIEGSQAPSGAAQIPQTGGDAVATPPAMEPTTGVPGDVAVVDVAILAELRALESDIDDFSVADMVALFEEQGRELLEELERTLGTGDLETFTRSAHTLKGSARELGAVALGDVAEGLERAGKAGDLATALATAPAAIATARAAHARACEALRDS